MSDRRRFTQVLTHPFSAIAAVTVFAGWLFGLTGCTQSYVTAKSSHRDLTCAEATDAARGAVFRLGYGVEKVEPAKPGQPGKVVGRRNANWQGTGTDYTAMVVVECSNEGAEFTAIADESFPESLGFRQRFYEAMAEVAKPRPRAPRKPEPGQKGLLVAVEPLRSSEAESEFGGDLHAAGVTAVRISITNRTTRTYGFERARVQLVTQEGARVDPIEAKAVAARLSKAPAAQSSVRSKVITDGEVAPGAERTGFLYFPASTYRSAKVVMEDRDNDETEGFSIEF